MLEKFFSLKRKLLVLFTICIAIPVGVVFSIFVFYETTVINEEIERYAAKQVSLLAQQMDWYFRSVQYISKNYYNNELINDIVSPNHSRDKETFLYDQLALLDMKRVNNYTLEDTTLQITVITADGDIYGTNLYRKTFQLEEMQATRWYQQLEKNPWDVLWIQDDYLSDLIYDTQQERIYNIWALKDPHTYELIGVLIVDFSLADLTKQFEDFFDDRELFVVQDMYGKTVFCSNNQLLDATDAILHGIEASGEFSSSGYYLVHDATDHGKWSVFLFTTQNAAFDREQTFVKFFFQISVVYLISIVILTFLISKKIVQPIQALTATMRVAQDGNMSARASIYSHDEIGELANTYNSLLDKIDHLVDNIKVENEKKRYAEMQALASQINPHFIINTLTSIRALIYQRLNERAEQALPTFSYLLKNVLSTKEEFCPLSKEIELIKKCIEIYQMSFEHPIQVSINADSSLYNCMVIKMITMPIVENAVMHGLKAKDGDKILSIQIYQEDGIRIDICDNGIGCDKKYFFQDVSMLFDRGIGMQNVYNRIVLHHGPNYGLQFHSKKGVGTSVSLHLPIIYQEGAEHD